MSENDLSEADVRHAMAEVFTEHMFRLDTRYVLRGEFEAVRKEGVDNTKAIAIIETKLERMATAIENLASIVGRVGWTVVLAVIAAVLANILPL
jgi:hypothetical protein